MCDSSHRDVVYVQLAYMCDSSDLVSMSSVAPPCAAMVISSSGCWVSMAHSVPMQRVGGGPGVARSSSRAQVGGMWEGDQIILGRKPSELGYNCTSTNYNVSN